MKRNNSFNINDLYYKINNSKYLTGIALIILNLFSKYIQIKLTKSQEEFIKNMITREILIFTIIFIGIRDIITSIIMTAAFIILSDTVFNHKSKFCILPEKYKKLENTLDLNKDGKVTNEEIEKAKKILKNANIYNIY
tara:strand:+ start:111 stop:524 length:414 start_codon:yes stop_codon:yes gene_type:complete